MKKADVHVGRYYAAKVSGKMATVRIDAENPRGGWDATNLRTNKQIRVKSPQRLRHETRGPGQKATPAEAKAIHDADQANARLAEQRANSPDGMTASERAMAESAEDAATAKKARKAAGKAKGKTGGDTGERGGRMSALDAAAKVLAESGEPMSTRAMFDAMVAKGYWTSDKATPQNTIYAAIAREIKTKGDDSRFRKGDARGTFELNR